jgi:hypothetical protein
LVEGDRRKDTVENVTRYAELGISEYFVLDVKNSELFGYRLAPGRQWYTQIELEKGRMWSAVLDLDFQAVNGELLIFDGDRELPWLGDVVQELRAAVDKATKQAIAAEQQIQAERREKQMLRAALQAAELQVQAAEQRELALAERLVQLEAFIRKLQEEKPTYHRQSKRLKN